MSFAQKMPRRHTYIIFMGIHSIATSLMATYFFIKEKDASIVQDSIYIRMFPLLSIIMVYICNVFATHNIAFILQSEILPLRGRSFGSGLLGLIDNLSLFLCTKLVPTFESSMGMHGMFIMFSCISFFVGIACIFVLPETKGMTLEEIEKLYTPESKKTNTNIAVTVL